tara:strand:+ start:788 stop:1396 length:609 start_codon:yes stop_codon:yes gene_type:complete
MLYAAFYRAEGMYRGCFNSLATLATNGPYCHCEFVFRWTPEQLQEVANNLCGFVRLRSEVEKPVFLCLYIIWGRTVDYRFLTEDASEEFFRVPAHMLPMDVTFEQEIQIAKWVFSQYGAPYDKVGAMLCMFHWRKSRRQYNRYFCSQLMACALNNCGLTHIANVAISPNRLYHYLTAHQCRELENVRDHLLQQLRDEEVQTV